MTLNIQLNRLQFSTHGKFVTCALLVALADILFYGHDSGWTLGLFGLLMLAAVAAHNRIKTTYSMALFGLAGVLALALVESPTTLGLLMFAATSTAAALSTRMQAVNDARALVRTVLDYVFTGWWRLQRDSIMLGHIRKRLKQAGGATRLALLRNWLLPVGLSAVFILLFAEANPIITRWVAQVDWRTLSAYASFERTLYWLVVASACWALIRPRNRRKQRHYYQPVPRRFTLTALLFNERSIFTSLVMFNGLFLIENLLDIAFIWSGMDLPEGMTYADYAHQGAYPLMATALLAAVFVLIALRPGSESASQRPIRMLVYAWVGQNVFLMVSSVLRLAGYVEQYSLTWLRVAAFIWMGLVAVGLLLIVARIYYERTSQWLINTNSFILYATLYICCFINFGGMIADYNLTRCDQRFEQGYNGSCDIFYLYREVGGDALPALIRYEKGLATAPNMQAAIKFREQLSYQLEGSLRDWRQWTFRNWRLAQSLKQ